MKINVVGWFDRKNVGDECFRYVLKDFFSGHDVKFVTPPSKCDSPDIVVLGGGAVASPFYLNILPDCPRYAIGIDLAYESESELIKNANFKEVYIRNNTDCNLLKTKVLCPVHLMPDLAFYLSPTNANVLIKYKKTSKKTLGVFVTDYVNPALDRSNAEFRERADFFTINLAKKLDELSNEYEIILVPCSTAGYGNDIRINLDLVAFMRNQPTYILETLNPIEMIDLMKDLDLALCMRFHAHIFALITETPIMSIEFTKKVKNLLEEHDLLDSTVISYKNKKFDFSNFEIKQKTIKGLSKNYKNCLEKIKKQVRQDWLG